MLIQTFTAKSVSASVAAFAIGRTLIFRLGIGQTEQVRWSESTESISAAVAFSARRPRPGELGLNTIETSADHTGRVIQYILGKHSTHREGILRASYNGVDLRVELIYEGSLAEHLPALTSRWSTGGQ